MLLRMYCISYTHSNHEIPNFDLKNSERKWSQKIVEAQNIQVGDLLSDIYTVAAFFDTG